MIYSVFKRQGIWRLARVINGAPHEIATYPTRKAALLTAQLLAGRHGHIVEHVK